MTQHQEDAMEETKKPERLGGGVVRDSWAERRVAQLRWLVVRQADGVLLYGSEKRYKAQRFALQVDGVLRENPR